MYRFYGWQTADVRDRRGMTPRDYYDLLSGLWAADTCAPRMRRSWSPQNPTLGQCSITAFLVQDIYGGEVLGVPLADGAFHCFNAVDGCVFDLTSEQFGDEALDYAHSVPQRREDHFARAEKRARYGLLRGRLAAALRARDGCDGDLAAWDGQLVRLMDLGGETFEGICEHNSPAYNGHEYGREEAGLQIERLLFYESDIARLERLEAFSGPYGRLEEATAEAGLDLLEEALDSEKPAHVLRQLRWLEDKLDGAGGRDWPDRDGALAAIRRLRDAAPDESVRGAAAEVLRRLGQA